MFANLHIDASFKQKKLSTDKKNENENKQRICKKNGLQ